MFNIVSGRNKRPEVVLFFGPTGVGKTALLERLFAGIAEVISADALQIYRGMDIGTAKPSPETLALIPHHLIDIRGVEESFSVGEFCHIADYYMRDTYERGLLPVISGGTAYYIKTWLLGGPGTPPA
ncbi:MAG: tRNA (adenosine(37)-N6)-dimethylallyltransferase MiaA, partial [spirochete symbiont of Stewartia floridana]